MRDILAVCREAAASWRERRGYDGGRSDPFPDNIEHYIAAALKEHFALAQEAMEACVELGREHRYFSSCAHEHDIERCHEVGRRILAERKKKDGPWDIKHYGDNWYLQRNPPAGCHKGQVPLMHRLSEAQAKAVAKALNDLERA